MNPIAEEIESYKGCGSSGPHLAHYGVGHDKGGKSGRYPWGSGEDPQQRSKNFIDRINELKKNGWTETPENIKKAFDMSTGEFREAKAVAKTEIRQAQVARAKAMKEKGLGATKIAEMMSTPEKTISESTVRSWLNEKSETRMNQAKQTAEFLKKQIEEKGMIDVTKGVELELGVSRDKFNQALKILGDEGYPVYKGGIPQVTNPGKQTTQAVLCKPGTEHKEIYNYENVHTITEYASKDGGVTFKKFQYPASLDSKRLMIRYDEDGGTLKDGIVELRRGVPDLDLGGSHYAQVRILVDGRKYIKGMAVYSDDMPDGIDVIVNSNKKREQGFEKALKDIKDNPDNPFGSAIKPNGQSYYIGKDGKEHLSLINKRADEGDWSDWKDKLPAQFLSKQPLSLAKKQLSAAIKDKQDEFDSIMKLENPTVKKVLLNSFAEDCDSAAVHLQAAALPGQKYHVIIPINSLKDNEIYAPKYENGTQLACIRYPHGGTFEIPILTVNNKNKLAKQILGNDIQDAVGITKKVADRLSGADFDGDTVMCIPTNNGKVKIKSTDELKGLKGFEPKDKYSIPEGNPNKVKIMKNTQTEMGKISNLITDMTLLGADENELAAAVRHSMVVIDAEKHKLDYKQSEKDNHISELKKKYQRHTDENGNVRYGGASTLISRSKGEQTVDKRQGSPRVNLKKNASKNTENDIWYDPTKPEGSLLYKTADDLEYTVKKVNARTGKVTETTKHRTQKSTRMAETNDARTLISEADTAMERAYADYANAMKNMANQARIKADSTGKIAMSKEAKIKYKEEVDSLDRQLKLSLSNAPKERQAQRLANIDVAAQKKSNPDMKKADIKKAGQIALTKYRDSIGAKRTPINISDKEWEAIQEGAISESKLIQIINHTDKDRLRQLATPRETNNTVSAYKESRIKAMSANGLTIKEIAKATGVSTSTVSKLLKGEN